MAIAMKAMGDEKDRVKTIGGWCTGATGNIQSRTARAALAQADCSTPSMWTKRLHRFRTNASPIEGLSTRPQLFSSMENAARRGGRGRGV